VLQACRDDTTGVELYDHREVVDRSVKTPQLDFLHLM
jgi:hypothetical protein